MLRFPYRQIQPERLGENESPPPSLLIRLFRSITGQSQRSRSPGLGSSEGASEIVPRPLVSVRIRGPVASRRLKYALLDTGSQDMLLPAELAESVGIILGGETKTVRWRGRRHPVEFHIVEFELSQGGVTWRWRGRAGFTPAPLPYALLGQRGCLEFLDATFRGADQVVDLETNRIFPGTVMISG